MTSESWKGFAFGVVVGVILAQLGVIFRFLLGFFIGLFDL